MQNPSSKTGWLASFAAALKAYGIDQGTVDMVSEPMWSAAGLLDPQDAASEYVNMLVSSGMKERRRSWRGLPADAPPTGAGTTPGDVPASSDPQSGSTRSDLAG